MQKEMKYKKNLDTAMYLFICVCVCTSSKVHNFFCTGLKLIITVEIYFDLSIFIKIIKYRDLAVKIIYNFVSIFSFGYKKNK